MSLIKQRIKSASASHDDNKPKKKRYEKLVTQSSQEFHREPQSKIRSYSREQSKKAKLNHTNLKLIKEPEQMIEENLNLKMFINDLQDQLALQRGRLQMNKKKTQKYVKQLNRQFDKELYYSGKNPHSYMFSGIKQQYQNMKHLYEQKCQEIEQLAQSMQITNFQEATIYIEALQNQNKMLKNKLDEFYILKNEKSKIKKAAHGHKPSQIDRLYTQQEQDEINYHNGRGNHNYEQMIQQRSEKAAIDHYKSKNKEYQKEIAESKKKIKFLEQLIIQKDNNEHQAKKEKQKLVRIKNQLEIEVNKLKQNISTAQRDHLKQINQIIEIQSKKFQIQSNIFKNALLEKNDHIQKLQKEIRFLSTMLSYWKPLDQINRNDFLGLKQPSEKQDYSESFKAKPNELRKSSVASDHFISELAPPNINIIQTQHDRSVKSNREQQLIKKTSGVRSLSQQNVISLPKERVPQTCGKKFKSTAKKCRKVQLRQIKGLGQLLRYRLIGNNFNPENLKKIFDLCDTGQESDKEFRMQYISMKQIKAILMNTPFNLCQQQAVLISRYIVQDEVSEFVYWDEDNEIKRTIAKSIIKTLIGDYVLPQYDEIGPQWQRFKSVYLTNIQSALKIIAPKGVISEAKFIQLLIGLGIQLKDQLKDWMIATMVISSPSLAQLNYKSLIPQ